MSGSNVWKLRLTTEGADQVVRDLRAAATESAAAARAYDALIKAQPGLATGAERAEQALRKNVDAMRGMRGELNLLGAATQGATSSLGQFGAALTSPAAAMTALGAATAAGVVQIARLGDQYTETMNKLRAATGSVQAASGVYAELVALSQQTGASISESAGAFVRFSVAARSIGATNGEVLQLTRTIQQAGLISGASTQEAAAGVQQLGQALASGSLQGDELRSILENMPTLAEALARELGVSIGQLRTMGSEGQLTSDRVFQALLRAGVGINQQFTELTPTMGRAFSVLGQAMVEFVGKLDQALGLSQRIAQAANAAAGAVRGMSGAITPRTGAEQAQADMAAAERRQAELMAEIERLRSGAAPASRRGSISRGLQETASGAQDRAARIAELEASYRQEQQIAEAAQLRLVQITEEGALAQFNEGQQANQRRADAQRASATESFNAARDALDRERKLRTEHSERVKAIDEGLAVGATNATDATRLRAIADRELADGLKSLEPPTRAVARATQSRNEADREGAAMQREGETVTRSVRSEAEKYADEVARLTGLLDAGAISQDTYNRAVAAADPAIKAASEASRRIEQENTRTTDRITSFFGDAFARAFEGTGNGFKGLMESFKRAAISTFASIASQAIIRPIVAPIVQGLGLGQIGGLGGGGGGGFNLGGQAQAGAATPTAGGGGLTDSLGSFQSLRTAYNGLTSPGGLGSFFPGGAPVNSGFSGLDSVLNTSLVTPTLNSITPTVGAAGTFLPAGVQGPILPAALPVAEGGLSIAGALGPAASIAGGAYGVYSGIQRGGVGGYTSAVGGAVSAATGIAMLALPALGALGPIGLAIGAILAIAGSLMPGEKPSGMGQLARTNLNSGMESTEGLGGKRFSQDNATAAGSSVDNVVALAREIGAKLGGATIGGDVAVGVTRGDIYLDINGQKTRAVNSEQGAKDIAAAAAKMILNEFNGQGTVQGPYRGILAASGDSLEKLDANLQWYEQVYKAYEKQADAGDKVAQATEAVVAKFNPLIDKAHELGLSSDRLVEARERESQAAQKAVEDAERARQAEILSIRTSLDARMAATRGVTDMEAVALVAQTQRTQAWSEELRALEERLKSLGLETDDVAREVEKLQSVQSAEYWKRFGEALREIGEGNEGRVLRATGRTGQAEWMDFERGATQQIENLRRALAELGAEASTTAAYVAQTENVIQAERDARWRAANEQAYALDVSNASRTLRAQGRTNEADLFDFETGAVRELQAVRQSLMDLGFSAEIVAGKVLDTERAIGVERIALQKRIADEIAAKQKQAAEEAATAWRQTLGAGQSIRSFLDAQRTNSGPGGVSTAQAFTNAQEQFGNDLSLARVGDADALARITSTADRLLQAGQNQFASGVDFQAVRNFVLASLETLPATRSYDALILAELQKLGGRVNVEVGIAVVRTITEALNVLPAADMAKLVQAQTVLRTVQQTLGRDLTAQERASLVQSGSALRLVEQTIGRNLSDAERDGLIISARIERNVEQALRSNLTAAERASLIEGGFVTRAIEQIVGAPTGGTLVTPGSVTRAVTQAVETTETVQISRSIDDKLSGILNAQLVIGREQLASDKAIGTEANGHTKQIMSDLNIFWRTAAGVVGSGLLVRSNWSDNRAIVGFAKGGVFDSTHYFPMADGRTGMLGEAGPEAIMPLDRAPDGRLGVRAMGGMSDALARMVDRMAREIAALRGEVARLIRAGERTADATEDTAATNARMMQRDVIVGRRGRAA